MKLVRLKSGPVFCEQEIVIRVVFTIFNIVFSTFCRSICGTNSILRVVVFLQLNLGNSVSACGNILCTTFPIKVSCTVICWKNCNCFSPISLLSQSWTFLSQRSMIRFQLHLEVNQRLWKASRNEIQEVVIFMYSIDMWIISSVKFLATETFSYSSSLSISIWHFNSVKFMRAFFMSFSDD